MLNYGFILSKSYINMKSSIWLLVAGFMLLTLVNCGPVIVSSRPGHPPPPWFYPNRIEVVRYVYFPEYRIYYDLSERTYLYLDGGVWIRARTVPPAYRNINLARSRYVRIPDYQDDNIAPYHNNNRSRGRSNLNTPPSRRNK